MKLDSKISIVGRLLLALSFLGLIKIAIYLSTDVAAWRIGDAAFDLVAFGFLAYPFLTQKWHPKLFGKNPKIMYYLTVGVLGLVAVPSLLLVPPALNIIAASIQGGVFTELLTVTESIKQPLITFILAVIIYPITFLLIIQKDIKARYLAKFEAKEEEHDEFDLRQEKVGHIVGLTFKGDSLDFYFKTPDSTTTREVFLSHILRKQSDITERNEWFRNVGYLWLALGFYLELMPIFFEQTWQTPLWSTLGVIALAIYYTRQVKFTVVETSGNSNILVIQNEQHDDILKKIYSVRDDFLKEKFGTINLDNDPDQEINKFDYLRKEGVIDQEKFDDSVAKIKEHHKVGSIKSPFSP